MHKKLDFKVGQVYKDEIGSLYTLLRKEREHLVFQKGAREVWRGLDGKTLPGFISGNLTEEV